LDQIEGALIHAESRAHPLNLLDTEIAAVDMRVQPARLVGLHVMALQYLNHLLYLHQPLLTVQNWRDCLEPKL
jgi:hypothetical protein